MTIPERFRLALQELGPLFVKLGQILSTRPDITPKNFITELEKLQNQISPVTAEEARGVVEAELGKTINEVFSTFEDIPIAAASLSQVHRAVLATGEIVAVKVQRPGIKEIMDVDLEILHDLVVITGSQFRRFGITNAVGLVEEFSQNLKREYDFRREANNMQRFSDNFKDDQSVHVPKVYHELSTECLVVMEYIDGIGVSEIEKLETARYDRSLIARRCADLFLTSTLEHGFYHADPHPGNVLIMPGNVICLLDFGLMGLASSRQREKLAGFIYEIWRQDERRVAKSLLQIVQATDLIDEDAFERDVGYMIQEYTYLPATELKIGSLLNMLRQLLVTHKLSFPTQLVWLLKVLATSEAIIVQLGVDFDMVEYARQNGQKLLKKRFSPLRQARDYSSTLLDFWELIKELPYEAKHIFYQLSEGLLKVKVEHVGLEPLRRSVERASNRLALAFIVAALLVGSSFSLAANISPIVGGMPFISFIGYIIAVVLGILLLISILRKPRP